MSRLRYPFILVSVLYLTGFFHFGNWRNLPSRGDDTGYYLHVVSFWLNGDVGDYRESTAGLLRAYPEARPVVDDPYLIRPSATGRTYIKYPVGVALMETPFFWVAHGIASLSDAYRADGWELPYLFMISFGNLIFVLLGLWILMRLLEARYSRRVSALTLVAIGLATNLFYQGTYVTMAHGFLFFDYCLLLWLTIRFYRKPRAKEAFLIGLVCGLIFVTRVPEVICAIIPLIWGITSRKGFLRRIRAFRQQFRFLLWGASGWLVPAALQLGYWQFVSGQLIFNPYQGEGFDFLRPEIWLGWFDFANGWLIYTPVMFFSLAGLLRLPRSFPALFLPLVAFLTLHVWIHYAYYAWTYYPGLGQRPMVETYPLLAFGLAASFRFLLEKKGLFRWIPPLAVLAFSALNLFQTWQMGQGILFSERGNAAYYYETFGAVRVSRAALLAYDTGLLQPDSNQLGLVQTLAKLGFEDSTRFSAEAPLHVEGGRAFFLSSGEDTVLLTPDLPLDALPQRAWLKASLWAYIAPGHKIWNRDHCADLVLQIRDGQGRRFRKKRIKMSSYVGNPGNGLWDTGTPGKWGEAAFFVRLPRKAGPGWTVQAFLFNPYGQRLYLDDFRLEVFEVNPE